MKIGIVGWGVEGQSAYHFFGPENDYLIVNEEPRDDFPPESDKVKVRFINQDRTPGLTGNVAKLEYLDGLQQCDRIVYSVTSYLNLNKKFGNDQTFWTKATTVNDIFFETVKTKNIIGVTGTKGKGTTCTLIAKMLEAEGMKVYLGGNIGKGVLDFVKDVTPEDWVVLEMSSFQLMNLPHSPHIAVCLMITMEHQDWHATMTEYVEAKASIFKYQTTDDIAIYYAKSENSRKIAQYSPGKKIPYYEKPGAYVRDDGMIVIGQNENEVIPKTEVKLLGEHNLQNICAASTAVFEAVGSLDKAKAVLSSFSGLEHRLELVRELDGVKYYDDSFATTPDSTIVALKAFKQPKIVILGGSDKGLPFDTLADEVTKTNVKHAIIIGKTADKLASLLKENGFTKFTLGLTRMVDIVDTAQKNAQPGDVVLLSTACASFGLFRDYKDRGNRFKSAVQALS
ncbi:MAG TPA: UDP-N-acetylmuramoyl-L-alanine--D-glutamate ligase [Candidatus Saccharimonadales bacterium]|nr:UDP-N-acetylmuramoyl-L-alanine--D-glutamate ligase [Candidatus Saccharimonadales bacterium]